MIRILTLSILVTLNIGCSQKEEVLQRQVERYFNAAFSQDFFELEKILADDCLFVGPKITDSLNKEELIESWASFHEAFDQATRNNRESYAVNHANGPEVFYYYESEFHHREKDVWLRFPLHVRVRFKESQISFIQIYVNQADIQSQMSRDG